jgi:mitogen-activated protein kinase kinase
MERELASMEISSSSSRSGSKLDANGSTNGSSKSTVKKTRKKSEKNGSNGSDSGHGFPELRDEDLKVVGDLGAGNGGTVNKVLHKETGLYMAKKVRYSPTPLRGLNIR